MAAPNMDVSADEETALFDLEIRRVLLLEQRGQRDARAEQLSTILNLSAMMGGFGATFLAQVNIPADGSCSEGVIIGFAVTSAGMFLLSFLSLIQSTLMFICIMNYDIDDKPEKDFEAYWGLMYDYAPGFVCGAH